MNKIILLLVLAISDVQALDYSIQASGPQHVTQGHYVYFLVTGAVASGTDENATPEITGLPAGAAASFPNMIKFCCGKFLWTIAGQNPVRIEAAPKTPAGTYQLTITYTSKSGIVRSTKHPLIVDAVPAELPLTAFPPDVPLGGLAEWKSNMLSFGKTHCVPTELATYEGFVWYYDGTRNYYQIADFTKDPKWLSCARALDAFYQNYVNTNNGNVQGWRVFPQGLAMGYQREGVAADKAAVLALLANGYANFANVAPVIDWSLSREISYGLETHLVAESLGNPRNPNFQNVAEILFGHFDQWFLTQNALYTQPFMVALAAEAMIDYFAATGDLRVPPLLKLAADQLWTVSWDEKSRSFWYYNNNGTPSSPVCMSQTDMKPCKITSPDLNLLIVPLYGWVYQHSGLRKYRDQGDAMFQAGVSGAYLQGGKQFSQNYRWSGKYVEWRKAPVPASR
jgi:hypothetical protein